MTMHTLYVLAGGPGGWLCGLQAVLGVVGGGGGGGGAAQN